MSNLEVLNKLKYEVITRTDQFIIDRRKYMAYMVWMILRTQPAEYYEFDNGIKLRIQVFSTDSTNE